MRRGFGWPNKVASAIAREGAATVFDDHAPERPVAARRKAGRFASLPERQPVPLTSGPVAVIAKMADFIVQRVAFAGNCTKDELVAAGFTPADLKHMAAAVTLAAKHAPGLQGGV